MPKTDEKAICVSSNQMAGTKCQGKTSIAQETHRNQFSEHSHLFQVLKELKVEHLPWKKRSENNACLSFWNTSLEIFMEGYESWLIVNSYSRGERQHRLLGEDAKTFLEQALCWYSSVNSKTETELEPRPINSLQSAWSEMGRLANQLNQANTSYIKEQLLDVLMAGSLFIPGEVE